MKLTIDSRLTGPLACILSLSLAACGGSGSAPNEPVSTTATPAVGVQSVRDSAPPPDSASVNGDQPFARMKAARLAATADSENTKSKRGSEAVTAPVIVAEAVNGGTKRTAAALSNSIYVSTVGDDRWSGALSEPAANGSDGPVKTLPTAQAIARTRLAAMAAGGVRAPVRVRLLPGTYYLTAPLEMTPADSGTAAALVYYEAVTPGSVVISGGVPLARSASPAPAGQVRFDVPAAAGTGWKGGGQLYVNDKRAVLARQPNVGQSWFVKGKVTLPTESADVAGSEAFTTSPEATVWIAGLSAADRSRGIVNVMQSWTDGHHRLSDQSTPAGSVRVAPRAAAPFLNYGLSQRVYVENVAAALDAPGEWLWESSGVRYIPAVGESANQLDAVMPVLDKLLVIQGDVNNRNWVHDIWFSGVKFAHTRHLTADQGETDVQAGVDVSAAIEVDGGVGIVIDNCDVSHTGGYGVWFRRAVRDSRITNSRLTDLGAGGLKLGQAWQQLTELQTGANSAVANLISDTGRLYAGAVAVWIGQSFDNLIANNAVFNTTYTAISAGWTWGYSPATSGRNRILNNLLVNIGQGETSDLGAIYTTGISPGTVISGNVIREVRGYPGYGPGAWGIYNDEGSSNVLMENNIVLGTDSGGYHLHYGRDNVVRNNLFALGDKFEMRVTRTDPLGTRLAFQHNLMIPSVQQPFDMYAHAPDVIFEDLQISDRAVGVPIDMSRCGSDCKPVTATVTKGADPRAVTVANTDAATIARYAQIARDAGPASLVSAVAIVEVPSAPPVVVAAPPTPLTIDPSAVAPNTQPPGFAYEPSDPSVIGVVRDATAPNGSCLAFNDSASFVYAWFPYVYTSLNHDKGVSTAEFTMKIDANTLMGHEWRDGGNPYKSGPALMISPAGITVGNRVAAPAPVGHWLSVRIVSPVDDPNGTWSLDVTDTTSGTHSHVDGLAYASAGWTKLIWMGFMSDATTRSTACLGGLQLTSSIH